MAYQEKFSRLGDPQFYLDFASRYAREGEHFFDMLECWCSFFGILLPIILIWFIFIMGVEDTHEIKTILFVRWIIIIALILVQIRVIWHANKERPRWHIARNYRDIARNDVYPLEKAYRSAYTITETEIVINNIRTFQKKFPIRHNALAAIIYNQCLIARGKPKQKFQVTVLDRLFPRCMAFFNRYW